MQLDKCSKVFSWQITKVRFKVIPQSPFDVLLAAGRKIEAQFDRIMKIALQSNNYKGRVMGVGQWGQFVVGIESRFDGLFADTRLHLARSAPPRTLGLGGNTSGPMDREHLVSRIQVLSSPLR